MKQKKCDMIRLYEDSIIQGLHIIDSELYSNSVAQTN